MEGRYIQNRSGSFRRTTEIDGDRLMGQQKRSRSEWDEVESVIDTPISMTSTLFTVISFCSGQQREPATAFLDDVDDVEIRFASSTEGSIESRSPYSAITSAFQLARFNIQLVEELPSSDPVQRTTTVS